MKSINSFFLVLTMSLMTEATLASDNWKHARLVSAEKIEISVDFISKFYNTSSNKPSSSTYASPIYFNITDRNLDSQDKVQVVLINHYKSESRYGNYAYSAQKEYIIDLSYAEGGQFTAQFSSDNDYTNEESTRLQIAGFSYSSAIYFWQEIAVVINGQWLTDPVGRTHNFQLNLDNVK